MMEKSKGKNLPAKTATKEIRIKKSAKAVALENAPDELIARAIHDTLIKEHERH